MATIRPQQPTLDDITQLAAELGVIMTPDRDSFELRKSGLLPLHGTYRSNQGGFNAAFTILVRHQNSLRSVTSPTQATDKPPP